MITQYMQQQQTLGFLEQQNTKISLEYGEEAFELCQAALSNSKKFLAAVFVQMDYLSLNIWDLIQRKNLKKIKFKPQIFDYFVSLQFSLDDKYLIYAHKDENKIVLLDLETQALKRKIIKIKDSLVSVYFSSDFQLCCTITLNQQCIIWNMTNALPLKTINYNQENMDIRNGIFFNFDRCMITMSVKENFCTQYQVYNFETNKNILKWQGKYISSNCELKTIDHLNLLLIIFEDEYGMRVIQIWSMLTISLIRTLSEFIEKFCQHEINQILGQKIIASSDSDGDQNSENDGGKIILHIFDILSLEFTKLTSSINLADSYYILPNAIIIGIMKDQRIIEIKVLF